MQLLPEYGPAAGGDLPGIAPAQGCARGTGRVFGKGTPREAREPAKECSPRTLFERRGECDSDPVAGDHLFLPGVASPRCPWYCFGGETNVARRGDPSKLPRRRVCFVC